MHRAVAPDDPPVPSSPNLVDQGDNNHERSIPPAPLVPPTEPVGAVDAGHGAERSTDVPGDCADIANQHLKSRRFRFIPSPRLQLGGDAQWRTARGAPERKRRRLGRDANRRAARISQTTRESPLEALGHAGASRLRKILGGSALACERGANAGERPHSLAGAADAELGPGVDARDR